MANIFGDYIKSGGKVVLELRDNKGNLITRRNSHNELSEAAKLRAVFLGTDYISDMDESPMGKTITIGSDGTVIEYQSGIYYKNAKPLIQQRCVVALNLTNKTVNEHYIPIFDTDGSIDVDVVLGWVNSAKNGGSNPYQGVVTDEPPKQSIVGHINGTEKRFYFDTNKGIGTYTHCAVMSGFGNSVNLTPYYGGFSNWQCLSRTNSKTAVIPPNITGLTGENEILIYNIKDDVNVYKVNISTGILIETSYGTEIFGSWFSSSTNIYKVKRIDSNHILYCTDYYIYIVEYNDGIPTIKASIYNTEGNAYNLKFGYYTISGETEYIYVSRISQSGTNIYNKVYKFNSSDWTYTTINAYSEPVLGGAPATISNNKLGILDQYDSKYYIGNCTDNQMLICTDPTDVCGSLVGTMNYPGHGFSIFETIAIPELWYVGMPRDVQDKTTNVHSKIDIVNPSTESNYINYFANYLCWLSPASYSNWYNKYELSSPLQKTSDNTVTCSWNIFHALS